ncbi:MAG: flagellar hook-associated protein FlgK [Planctomycetota bacterium]|jgi:flagellar hook-associated protein 1 FlgK
MSDYHIALSGLEVARRAIELVGTNIANVATEGYHRQDLRIEPIEINRLGRVPIGGSRIAVVQRAIDMLVESEILRQHPVYGQASQELATLQSIESSLDDVGAEGLIQAMNDFFGSLTELAGQPDSEALREQAVWAADTMAGQFRNQGKFFEDLRAQILIEAQSLIAEASQLARNIAQLNTDIESVLVHGGSANLLADRRDQAIKDLAELVDVQTHEGTNIAGVVNVVAWGTPLVSHSAATELEVEITTGGKLGVSVKDADYFMTNISGGRIGGLVNLANNVIPDIQARLDTLAKSIVDEINAHHVQGAGTAGTFTQLVGWATSNEVLSEWKAWGDTLSAGTFYIRVSDLQTDTATRTGIDVLATDTLADVATKLQAVVGINASVADGALRIEASDTQRYRFDFLPLPVLTLQGGWSGTSTPAISGTYTGDANETYTATVTTGGEVGLTSDLAIEITNGAGEVVTTLHPGAGYAAGDRLDVDAGISVRFDPGTLTTGETFTIEAVARTDSSGLLAAAGINTFLTGDSALTMGVCQDVMDDSQRLATATGEELNDNINVRRMAEVGETPLAALDHMAPPDSYRYYVTSVAQQANVTKARADALVDILEQLYAQRDAISGVDINDEAGKLLIFERMHQALAKVINAQKQSIQYLMDIL